MLLIGGGWGCGGSCGSGSCPGLQIAAVGLRWRHPAAELCPSAGAHRLVQRPLPGPGQPALGSGRHPQGAADLLSDRSHLFYCRRFYNRRSWPSCCCHSSAEEIRSNKTLVTVLSKGYRILVVVLAGATIAQESGLPLGSIVAGAGLLGLTISLAAQDTASNLFSGLVILLDRPFALGDWITVGDVEGEVVDINFRSTKIRAIDNTLYILTNSHVSNATINNGSQRTMRLYRFTLGVTYDTTRAQLEQLMADLTAYLKASEYTYEDTVYVKLTEFGASSINLSVSAYLRTPDKMRFLEMQNELNLDLLDLMKQNGVSLPSPPPPSIWRRTTDPYSATSRAIISAKPSTMLMTPALSSDCTASGIISWAVSAHHTACGGIIQPGQRCLPSRQSQSRHRPQRFYQAGGHPAQNAPARLFPCWRRGGLTAAPSRIFCSPTPRLKASAPLTASG